MKVIEGRQIAADTHRKAEFQMPQTISVTEASVSVSEVQTTSEVTYPTEIQTGKKVTHYTEVHVTKAVAQPIEIPTTETVTQPMEVQITQAKAHPAEVKAVVTADSRLQKLRSTHPDTLPDSKPVPLHIENAKVKDLQSMTRRMDPVTDTQNVQSVSIKPHLLETRSGRREMTLEELFMTGRKEEKP